MIELQHGNEPSELRDYRKHNPMGSWENPAFEIVRSTVKHQLNHEQEGLCIYCERLLNEDVGHVEHIKPKGTNSSLTFVYNNLAHSCDAHKHCGHHKKRQTIPVEPRLGCNRFFALLVQDGRLAPSPGLSKEEKQQAEITLRILGLNTPALAWERKKFADALRALANKVEVDAFLATAPFRWSLRGL